MNRQDKIKEGVADFCRVMRAEGELRHYTPQSDADGILEFLHSQGVVIKVDRPLPDISYHSAYPENEERYQQAMLEAGFIAVEPLINEG